MWLFASFGEKTIKSRPNQFDRTASAWARADVIVLIDDWQVQNSRKINDGIYILKLGNDIFETFGIIWMWRICVRMDDVRQHNEGNMRKQFAIHRKWYHFLEGTILNMNRKENFLLNFRFFHRKKESISSVSGLVRQLSVPFVMTSRQPMNTTQSIDNTCSDSKSPHFLLTLTHAYTHKKKPLKKKMMSETNDV